MPPITVDQGLNQNDPVTLKPGECALTDNAYYKPGDPILYKGLGRDRFNSSADPAIIGVRFLGFDAAADLFVTLISGKYRKATAGATGTFSDLVTGLAGTATSLDSAHYNNQHFLFNGVDRNRVVSSDGTTILHGMLAATAAPTVTNTGVGTGFTLASGAVVRYWVEERYKIGSTIVKRSASTSVEVGTITGTGATVKPVISKPVTVNSDATHWAAFGTVADGAFPVGGEIAEVAIGVASIEDTRTDGSVLPAGGNYEIVSFSDIFGVTQSIARNGPVPIATTGDVMKDCLVLNDVTDRSRLRYSLPDTPHKFPANQFIRFETKEEDEIVAFRFVGSVGVCLLRDSAWAVVNLPRPDDSAFQIESVKKQIDGAFGCVGPKALDVFSFGYGALLAYVSPEGVVWTDGSAWSIVTDDIADLFDLVEPSALSKIVLTNNRTYYRLEMRYTPLGGSRNTKVFLFHYHPSHLKAGANEGIRCKVSGPLDLPANDACVAYLNSRHVIFTANEDGKLYQEDIGYAFDSGESPTMLVRTRDEYLGGIGGESHIRSALVHHPASPGVTASVRMNQLAHGQDVQTVTATLALDRREASPLWQQAMADAFQFEFECSTTAAEVGVTLFSTIDEPSKMEGR